ncbi:hypothetical protein [Embleya scabrispora]|uniref:hypothetical protein n=1 Tax=Embleya scabrispora TaxID=159449 RepID=UPI0003A41772|nr:hypothetical protein [Embleya scabrispora]MYS87350.1 hypothetical protein [Streptomyces sp. SID5474]
MPIDPGMQAAQQAQAFQHDTNRRVFREQVSAYDRRRRGGRSGAGGVFTLLLVIGALVLAAKYPDQAHDLVDRARPLLDRVLGSIDDLR